MHFPAQKRVEPQLDAQKHYRLRRRLRIQCGQSTRHRDDELWIELWITLQKLLAS